MDSIDTCKLIEEGHSPELLFSKEWQQGYECCNSFNQKRLNEILGNVLTIASTKLSASASLDIGSYIIDHLKENSLLTESDAARILMKLTNQAKNINAKEFSMYDPEMHPDLGEFVMDGKDRLYTWSKENLQKYP